MGFMRIGLIQYGRISSRLNHDGVAAGLCGQVVLLFILGIRAMICTSIMSILPSVRL
jgi:hypothetical protein